MLRLVLRLAFLVAAFAVAVPHAAFSQDYPRKPIRMIMPNAAGASVDILGRIVAIKMSEALGEQMIVENRAGAGGAIGMEGLKNAAPDGYTVLGASTAAMSIIPNLRKNLPYEPLKDFGFVSLYAITPNALVVNPNVPVNSTRELIDYLKTRGPQTNMASAGPGSQSHLAGLLFMQMTATESVHVPYKGGGPSVASVMANESQWTITPAPAVVAFLKQNRLRLLAHTLPAHSPLFPGVPTISETVPGYTYSGWTGLMVPRGTPPAIVARLRDTILKLAANPDFVQLINQQGAVVQTSTPEEFAVLVANEIDAMGKAVKAANLSIE
jgi:tripartite-type tricarboxylate transporter receptor subunit TctC